MKIPYMQNLMFQIDELIVRNALKIQSKFSNIVKMCYLRVIKTYYY